MVALLCKNVLRERATEEVGVVQGASRNQVPDAWIGQRVAVWVIGDRRAVAIGELTAVNELGVVVEEPGGGTAFCPWSGISTIRLGEPEDPSRKPIS